MSHLIGSSPGLGWTALKVLLLFLVAVVGLRVSQRRLLAELTVFDLVVAVAIGSIVGRTATSSSTTFLTGAVALMTLLVLHRGVAVVHRRGWLGTLLDRPPVVLVAGGTLREDGLRRAGLTEREAYRLLREASAGNLHAVDYVLFEERGALTIIRDGEERGEAVRAGLQQAGVDPAP